MGEEEDVAVSYSKCLIGRSCIQTLASPDKGSQVSEYVKELSLSPSASWSGARGQCCDSNQESRLYSKPTRWP